MGLQDIVKNKYKIVSIKHSGRKGIRGTDCKTPKYDGLVGCTCKFDKTPTRGKTGTITLFNHNYYEWWDLSMVLSAWIEGERLLIETENSIYEFEVIK